MAERSIRNRAFSAMTDGFFGALASAGGRLPSADPTRYGVERIRDVRYGDRPEQRLDVYRPTARSGPLPVVLYLHGGGFRALSKESHWLMGIAFARRGYVVLNCDYRLGPRHPYPAAVEDACAAWRWALDHAQEWGGDPSRIVTAGESAGANLAAVVALACCYRRQEPWAAQAFERGQIPRALALACGIYQVSAPAQRALGPFSSGVIADIEDCYLPGDLRLAPGLADPVCVLEAGPPERPLPPAFLPVGGWDPILEDTERMAAALRARGAEAIAQVYPREIHAFHALVFRARARACWREMLDFVDAWSKEAPPASDRPL